MKTKILENTFIKYCGTAIITSAINIGIYFIVYNLICKNILISNFFAYLFSITIQFILNKKRVFKNTDTCITRQIISFIITKIIAYFLDSGVLYICSQVFNWSDFVSKLISNCSTALSNYYLNKYFVFK